MTRADLNLLLTIIGICTIAGLLVTTGPGDNVTEMSRLMGGY